MKARKIRVIAAGFAAAMAVSAAAPVMAAFCAAERPPVRLPAATQRYQRPGVNQPLSAQS